MQIKLTPQESEKHFHNALCNGSDLASFGGITYSEKEYKKAEDNIKEQMKSGAIPKDDMICYEDVWMQILKAGGTLTYKDSSDSSMNRKITLSKVHNRVGKTSFHHLMNAINENDDGYTALAILQTVIFGKEIYG